MPITLDPTVGGSASNTLGTLEEANAYFSARLYSTPWTSLTGDDGAEKKKAALVSAMNELNLIELEYPRSNDTQRLLFPVTCEPGVIPEAAKFAQFETALHLLALNRDPNAPNLLSQFDSLKLTGLAIEPRNTGNTTSAPTLPDIVWRLLAPWLPQTGYLERG